MTICENVLFFVYPDKNFQDLRKISVLILCIVQENGYCWSLWWQHLFTNLNMNIYVDFLVPFERLFLLFKFRLRVVYVINMYILWLESFVIGICWPTVIGLFKDLHLILHCIWEKDFFSFINQKKGLRNYVLHNITAYIRKTWRIF